MAFNSKTHPISITTEEKYQEIIQDKTKLIVLDIHSAWCNPCYSMVGPYDTLLMEMDDFNEKVQACYVNADLVPSVSQYKGTSKPRFHLYKNGELIEEVLGANAPRIMDLIKKHAPTMAEE